MALQLTSHFVAFVDILGFSAMVQADCETADTLKYLPLLHDAHLHALTLLGTDLETGLIQMSDSVVLSKPFNLHQLSSFLEAIAAWQRELIIRGLLCRGGVAFGKHFVKDRFLFSKAMIDAYNLERSHAKFPRIIVSTDLIELARGQVDIASLRLLKEEDGAFFINYLHVQDANLQVKLKNSIIKLIAETKNTSSDIQEKMRWLARYSDYELGTTLASPQFEDIA
jgi:hypothetical protein